MMNSICEFDQPLDLRLKALNLSLGAYQKQPASDLSYSSSFGGSNCSSNRSSSTSLTSQSAIITPNMTSNTTTNHPQNTNLPTNFMSQHNLAQYRSPPPPHNYVLNQPLNSSQCSSISSGSINLNNSSTGNRSMNIHCQPLNHHQPHPLSRLHPTPTHIQSQNQQQSSQNSRQPHAHSAPTLSLSHLNLPARLDSPCTSQQIYQPLPMKSLSISSHHHLPSPNFSSGSLQVSSHSSSLSCSLSAANQQKQQQQQQQIFSDIPHQQLIQISSTVNQTNKVPFAASSPGVTHHLSGNQTSFTSQQNAQPTPNTSNTSPMTRQHSLVSRYNCKPCGIVFSQPETLRAHQEGYCTKRDRVVQTQMRSQSVVSPTVIQQTVSDTK